MKQLDIKSKDNDNIKILRKLKQKKYREKFSEFFVENFNIINDALGSGFIFDRIFVTKDFLKKNNKEFGEIIKISGVKQYFLTTDIVFKTFSDLENPSGICAVYKKISNDIKYDAPIVYLNGINNPGNLGTILRSASAFSFKSIVIDEHSADLYNYKTINAAKDAIFKLNISFDKNLKNLKRIKDKMDVFSTIVDGTSGTGALLGKDKFCVVFGRESFGVDDGILKLSNGFITVKTEPDIESLNVASSAAIIFHQVYKNR